MSLIRLVIRKIGGGSGKLLSKSEFELSNSKHFVQRKRNDGPTANRCEFISPTPNIPLNQNEMMGQRLSMPIYFAKTKHSVEKHLKKIGGETAVKSEFNSPNVCDLGR